MRSRLIAWLRVLLPLAALAILSTLFLLGPSWRQRTPADKRRFVDRFLVRALVPQIRQ